MKILNKLIPIINTYDPNNPKIDWTENITAGANCLRNEYWFNLNFKIWYCLFSCEHSFKIYNIKDLVEKSILDKVLEKKAFLVLDNALEPFVRSIDSIYHNIVIKENIPASQIIFLTNMHDAKEYSDNLAKKLNQERIKVFWYSLFEQDLQCAVEHIYKKNLPKTLQFKKYDKKFLNLNRRWRMHRPFLITLMHGRNLLDSGHVSFGPCDQKDTWVHRWHELFYYFRNELDVLNLLKQYESVKDMKPLFLDTEELHINRAVPTVDTNRYYEETYFSVITETTYFTRDWYPNVRFLSEKAFKPIAMKHPFIFVTVPNSLDILRKMGYKTFSPIIDESYDTEIDDAKRMLMIVNEIERLSNLNDYELEDFIIKAREICNYNYKNLMSKKQFIVEM